MTFGTWRKSLAVALILGRGGFRFEMINNFKSMKLSEEELHWLKRWEKRERLWMPITRWICIFCGILSVALGIFLIHKLSASDFSDRGQFVLVPFFFFGMAGIWFGCAFIKWRGDIKLRLLLRLIREHEDKDA
jgi:hypothetical protein